jgi:hypothetical protein
LTTTRADDPVVWRTVAGELTYHYRFLDPECRARAVHALRTKIHENS